MSEAQQNAADFSKAMTLLQRGRFADAIPIYERILRREPANTGAGNLLGIALIQAGKLEEAAAVLENVLRADPVQSATHYNLGTVFQRLGRNDKAITQFQKAISFDHGDAQAHNNLGVALKNKGRVAEAAGAYRRAIAIKPDFDQAHSNLAAALYALDRFEDAIQSAERAIGLNSNSAGAYVCLGNALHILGRTPEALQAFDRAIILQPNRPEAYLLAANAMVMTNRENDALPLFRRAVELDRDSANSHFQLAACLHILKRHDEAAGEAEKAFQLARGRAEDEIGAGQYLLKINENARALAHFKRALDLDPNSIAALEGYATSLNFLPGSEQAVQLFDKALQRKPNQALAMFNKAVAALSAGRFSDGWKFFDARLSREGKSTRRPYAAPCWAGEMLTGSLLVWGEQGIGDQILYASMIEEAAKRAQSTIVEIDPRLIPLFARSFPSVEVRGLTAELNEAGIAAHIPIGGLCEFFRNRWEDFPRRAYLIADRQRSDQLRSMLGADGKCTVGLSWRSVNQKLGDFKTAQLRDFAPLLERPEFAFFDFQYGDTAAELKSIQEELGHEVLHLDEIDNLNDIDGLAALIEACDAVVTVSNTTAHIAGALGKPVWIMVPHGQGRHWYWFRDRTDSPWYPGARIVRQQPGQSWADLAASIVPEILEFARGLKRGG